MSDKEPCERLEQRPATGKKKHLKTQSQEASVFHLERLLIKQQIMIKSMQRNLKVVLPKR
jgi:hypothetical protein